MSYKVKTFIEEYKMPLNICDEIITLYNDNIDKAIDGVVGYEKRIDLGMKESKEISIPVNEQKYISSYFKVLRKMLNDYCDKYFDYFSQGKSDFNSKWGPFSVTENTNIQYYPKGGGFKDLHFERMTTDTRHREMVFMTYLTDTKNAGTIFPNQNITTECVKGNTVIWPAGFTHPHKGVISNDDEKMIITGWINFMEA